MGTISERKRANGTKAYTAQIRIRRDGKVVHTEAQTFDRRPAANAWLKKRETELNAPGVLLRPKGTDITLAQAIERYERETVRDFGRTKLQVLKAIKGAEIAQKKCRDIASHDIVAYGRELGETRTPQTVDNYLSFLSSVFAIAKPAWGVELDAAAMADARKVLKHIGAISKSRQRDRRPSIEELDRLLAHYADRSIRSDLKMPMQDIIIFALFSTRRQEEICRIQWEDLDRPNSRVLVRDMKNPGEKMGNHVWCDLVPEALAVIDRQPMGNGRIFPVNEKSVSASFTRACALLNIKDLHFHDLRHEGISRLFEMGWTIPHVAAVSGHRSWVSLKRYAHIKTRDTDKYQGWQPLRAHQALHAAWTHHADK
ncbi:integrase [Rhizobium rhizosphaerae]|uniref:Integrase n=1 Tax=Xaviernesmea rhizosphaerae TaxID=1672749 RepID=A0A1Q9AMQ3_9HYPH|nr:site-specific integrase [Xaviernesmea rhizosphaerae]OLP56687.1 integrase [Xaviernesmea rhizosphaerae]